MIVRIVMMTFEEEKIPAFIENFKSNMEHIRNFEGCKKLELLQEKERPYVYFTYSWWESEEALENYRNSELFKGVWKKTKQYFSAAPQAWSLLSKLEL